MFFRSLIVEVSCEPVSPARRTGDSAVHPTRLGRAPQADAPVRRLHATRPPAGLRRENPVCSSLDLDLREADSS